MSLMDSIDIRYVWKAIQESERSDEFSYPNTPWSDRLFQVRHSEPEHGDGEESRPKLDVSTLRARSYQALRQRCAARRWLERFGLHSTFRR